jgi:hypothetical protein
MPVLNRVAPRDVPLFANLIGRTANRLERPFARSDFASPIGSVKSRGDHSGVAQSVPVAGGVAVNVAAGIANLSLPPAVGSKLRGSVRILSILGSGHALPTDSDLHRGREFRLGSLNGRRRGAIPDGAVVLSSQDISVVDRVCQKDLDLVVPASVVFTFTELLDQICGLGTRALVPTLARRTCGALRSLPSGAEGARARRGWCDGLLERLPCGR